MNKSNGREPKDTADRLYESAGTYFAEVTVVLVECQAAEAERRTFCLFYANI